MFLYYFNFLTFFILIWQVLNVKLISDLNCPQVSMQILKFNMQFSLSVDFKNDARLYPILNVTQMWIVEEKCDTDVAKIQPIRKKWHFSNTDVTFNFSTGAKWNHISVTKMPLLPGILYLETPKFGNLMKNITVTVGRDAVLTCVVENLSMFKVAWLRVDTQTILTIQNHVITKNHRIAVSNSDQQVWRLHIKDVGISDRGWYMCQINTDPMKSQTAHIEVVAPPDILNHPTSSDMVVREGSNVTLQCAVTGSPIPSITWKKEDGSEIILDEEPRRASFVKNSLLTLVKVDWRHSGIYLCIASNGVPPTVSKRISLVVHYAPKVHIRNQLISANLGHSVTLECETEAYPKPIHYWTLDNGQLITDGEVYETFLQNYMYKVRMKLRIREVTPSSYRDYLCVSKNPLGTSEGSVRVYPVEAEWAWHSTSKPLGYLNNSYEENTSSAVTNGSVRLACMSLSLCIIALV